MNIAYININVLYVLDVARLGMTKCTVNQLVSWIFLLARVLVDVKFALEGDINGYKY